MSGIRKKLLSCAAGIAVAITPAAAFAQSGDAAVAISIPQQSLSGALTQLAEKTGLQLVYDAKIADGLTAPAVSGTMTAREALAALLAGSGLSYRFTSERSAIIAAAAGGAVGGGGTSDDGVRAVGVVSVEGANGPMLFGDMVSPVNGVNGSRDVQTTEGTGSYTTGAASIVSKIPQTLRETPQSVTVMTAQQLEDQSIVNIRGVMDKITGVTVTDGGNNEEFSIVSRGFDVNTFTFDGGAPVTFAFNNRPVIELSQYDSVQLVRGSNGTYSGFGEPGGTVNLVRKKPLDHNQFVFEQDIGSWNNFRSEIDVTGPLTADGKLRARMVATRVDREYFFDIANAHKTSIYGIFEYDVSPTTLFSIGASHVGEDNVPNQGGLPRYQDGTEIDFPRSTCLCVPYAYEHPRRSEVFGSLEQQVGKSINLRLNTTYSEQNVQALYYNSTTSVARGLFAQGNLGANEQNNPVRQLSIDLFATGKFSVLNRNVEVVLGGNYLDVDNDGGEVYFYGNRVVPDIFNFDPYSFEALPRPSGPFLRTIENGQRQYGAYASIKVEVLRNLNVSSAWRYSYFKDRGLFKYEFNDTADRSPALTASILSKPNIGVTYDFLKNFTAYASYQNIYKPQDQTRYRPEGLQIPPPITGSTKEAGLKWQSPNGRLNSSLSLYDIKQNNILEPTYGDPPGFRESYNVTSRGVDFEVAGEIVENLQILIGYSYNDNKLQSESFTRPKSSYTPHHILKTWATYRAAAGSALSGLIIGGGANWQSDSYQRGSICPDPPSLDQNTPCSVQFVDYEFTIDPYATLALKIGYQLSENVELSLSGENITDVKTYTVNPGTNITGYNSYLTPRAITGSMRLKW